MRENFKEEDVFMKKNSHKRWSFFLCLLMVLSLTAVGCEKKCSDDEIFVPDQEQTEGEGDAADTQQMQKNRPQSRRHRPRTACRRRPDIPRRRQIPM